MNNITEMLTNAASEKRFAINVNTDKIYAEVIISGTKLTDIDDDHAAFFDINTGNNLYISLDGAVYDDNDGIIRNGDIMVEIID